MKTIPTTKEIYNNLSSSIRQKLGITDLPLKKNLDALASVISGFLKMMYYYLTDIQKNSFPDTADSEKVGGTLEHWGRIYLNRDPNKAIKGVFIITITSTAGTVIPANTGFKTTENSTNPGQLYLLENEVITGGGSEEIRVVSDGEGTIYNQFPNDELRVTTPIIGLDELQLVSEVEQQPLDDEALDDYRAKILEAIQLEPQGGSKGDYREWSSDAGGVRIVYPHLKESDAGVVQVYVEATTLDSSDGLGTPTQAILDDVESVIEINPDTTIPANKRARRPIQAFIETLPIQIVPVDVTITGLNDDQTSVRTTISENLSDYLFNVRPFIDGVDLIKNKNDVLYLANLQQVTQSVLTNGNFFTNFAMSVDGVEKNVHTFTREKIPYLRNVNYV